MTMITNESKEYYSSDSDEEDGNEISDEPTPSILDKLDNNGKYIKLNCKTEKLTSTYRNTFMNFMLFSTCFKKYMIYC